MVVERPEGKTRGAFRKSADGAVGPGRAMQTGADHEAVVFPQLLRCLERLQSLERKRNHRGHVFGLPRPVPE